jgi:hypothetical protein
VGAAFDPFGCQFRKPPLDEVQPGAVGGREVEGETGPHDLCHRRISLLHRQGRTWAEIGALVGQRSLKVTSDTYTHVLVDSRELDYAALLTRP